MGGIPSAIVPVMAVGRVAEDSEQWYGVLIESPAHLLKSARKACWGEEEVVEKNRILMPLAVTNLRPCHR